MRRREFIGLLAAAAGAWPWGPISAARAAVRVYRIGLLETVPEDQNAGNLAALRQGLRELGYVEGQNLEFAYRSAEGRPERFPELAAELVRLPVDLIVTRGTPATQAAKAATTTLPIVMAAIGEPLNTGVVASLAHPGGNVTGLSSLVIELAGKRVELLKETFPSIGLVGFMINMGNPVAAPQWEACEAAARTLGIKAQLIDVRNEAEIRAAFAALPAHPLDALSVGIDGVIQANAETIAVHAAADKLVTIFPAREFAQAGGLLSYGPSYPDLYFRVAGLIDKIFRGAKPGDLPVEQPTKLELVVNLKTARALGVEVPASLLARADEVIE
jgi:putative ABC transport system substrate-binding protein